LRNSTDQQMARPPGRDLRELYALDRKEPHETAPAPRESSAAREAPASRPAPSAAPPAPPAAPPERVLVIRGHVRTEEPLDPEPPAAAEPAKPEEAGSQ
jgi:hypothetical protein